MLLGLTLILFCSLALADDEPFLLEKKTCNIRADLQFPCELYLYQGKRYAVGFTKYTHKVFRVEETLDDNSVVIRYLVPFTWEYDA